MLYSLRKAPIFSLKLSFIAILYLICFSRDEITGQNNKLLLKIIQTDSTTIKLSKSIDDNYFLDKKEITSHLSEFSESLNIAGYLNHNIQLQQKNDSLYIGQLALNERTEHIHLKFLAGTDLPKYIKNNQLKIEVNELDTTLANLYGYYESEGYTFTEIKLTNISSNNKTLTSQVEIALSKQRYIDKVVVNGYRNFPKRYLKNYLHLKPTTTFNKETVENTSSAISSLNFVSELRKPEVLFTKDSTQIYLYLKKQNFNKFDGLVGFTSGEDGKLQFNGYLDIALNNSFNKGEQLAFYWSNNGEDQEHFKLKVKTPYIFNSPITPSLHFELYKQDSSFINREVYLSLDYSINRRNTLGATLLSKNSTNLLSDNSTSLIETYEKTLYGASYSFHNLGKNNTSLKINTSASLGNKITETATQGQYYFLLDISLLEKITKKSSIYIHNKTETIEGNNLTENEFFQIGGANTIRGFYEESIFTPSYNFTNLEYRLLTSRESYIYTFSDVGITKNTTENSNDRLYSFGLGYAYKTKGGFINLNYAFGKINKTPFNFNQGIFHIKLTTTF